MATRRYGRWVIMLKQDTPAYSITTKEASGHCTIEIRNGKGRMTTFVQGLKHLQKDNVYKVCIASSPKNSALNTVGVTCALIPVDSKGKGEMKWEFDPDNVGGSGIVIEDFNVVFVAVKSIGSTNKELVTPLVGYMDERVSWKNNYKAFVKEKATEKSAVPPEINTSPINEADLTEQTNTPDTPAYYKTEQEADNTENTVQKTEQAETFEEKETNPQARRPLDENCFIENGYNINLEAEAPQYDNLQNPPEPELEAETIVQISEAGDAENDKAIYIESETGHISESKAATAEGESFSMFEDAPSNPHKEFKEKILMHKNKMAGLVNYRLITKEEHMGTNIDVQSAHKNMNPDLEYMFENNPVMNPFESQYNNYTWIRIALPDLAALPIDVWKYGNHPFLLSGYRKYNHFILGTYFESPAPKYILGVPGTYYSYYRLKASRLGFKQFKCCDSSTPVEGSYGYWLMNISNS